MAFVSGSRDRLLSLALAGLMGVAIGGCSSISSGQNSNSLSDKPRSPAEQAWHDLQEKSDASSETGFGIRDDPWKQRMDDEKRRADGEADRVMSGGLPVEALNGMVDEISQHLAASIPAVPEVKNSSAPLVLAFGNVSDASANPQLDQALAALRSKIAGSGKMTNNFILVAISENDPVQLSQKLAGKDISAFRDPLRGTGGSVGAIAYDPQSIFLITGKMFSVKQMAVNSVQITLSLDFVHVLSGRGVLTKQFTRSYMWNPDAHQFELQP